MNGRAKSCVTHGTLGTTRPFPRGLCFGVNGHGLVTNFFVLNFLRTILVGGILDLLIKSKLLSVHRRVQQPTIGTILRLKAKIVPTGQK